jgi:hypothetical protein
VYAYSYVCICTYPDFSKLKRLCLRSDFTEADPEMKVIYYESVPKELVAKSRKTRDGSYARIHIKAQSQLQTDN